MFRRVKDQGFTLVELMIVVVIISVLVLLGGANYLSSIRRGRDAERLSELKAIAAAQEQYYARFPGGGTYDTGYAGTPCVVGALASYFSNSQIPRAPTGNYTCAVAALGASYCVAVQLEEPGGRANCTGCNCTSNPCVMNTAATNTHFCVMAQQ